jgi:hypothetical protein
LGGALKKKEGKEGKKKGRRRGRKGEEKCGNYETKCYKFKCYSTIINKLKSSPKPTNLATAKTS